MPTALDYARSRLTKFVMARGHMYASCYRSLEYHWLDRLGWALDFSRSLLQASLVPAGVLQCIPLKTRKSFSRPSINLRFGLPFLRVQKPNGRVVTYLVSTFQVRGSIPGWARMIQPSIPSVGR
ncbi:hypothetical protein TNCV_3783621 [Trichonephila clavipes]|nr:hypothetical protein TNCV_3783621 [Trichonephila clavipes]